ncbi:MAG: hypothetical protein GXP26_09320 [Planctomycetes bacterium]|nr:hypothetical protein [Planctomycetota bacterium]
MQFNFEKFTDVDASFTARVTIRQRTGQIGFSSGAINLFSLQNYEFYVLYFDAESKVVGIEPAKEKVEGSMQIKQKPSNTYLTAKNFLDKYGIDYTESHRYELKRDDQSGFLYFKLGSAVDEPSVEPEAKKSTFDDI